MQRLGKLKVKKLLIVEISKMLKNGPWEIEALPNQETYF